MTRILFFFPINSSLIAIDFSYHSHYSPSRQQLHNSIIHRYLGAWAFPKVSNPSWIVFTAGAMGSGSGIPPSLSCSSFTGKSFTLSWLSENRFFPLENFLVLDFDIVREFLPESQLTHNTSLFTSLSIQKEVGYLVEVRRPHRFHLIIRSSLLMGR
jgi:hypothetical protein